MGWQTGMLQLGEWRKIIVPILGHLSRFRVMAGVVEAVEMRIAEP